MFMKKFQNPFKKLTVFEWCLWGVSMTGVLLAFLIPAEKDIPSLIASLIGVTALIFVAKGMVIGQVLTVALPSPTALFRGRSATTGR